jgi:hypothetical protein
MLSVIHAQCPRSSVPKKPKQKSTGLGSVSGLAAQSTHKSKAVLMCVIVGGVVAALIGSNPDVAARPRMSCQFTLHQGTDILSSHGTQFEVVTSVPAGILPTT